MDKIKPIVETLVELRVEAKKIKSEAELKETMHKYNMLIVGEKLNTIYARELLHYLRENRDYHVADDEFLRLIPEVCKQLGMTAEALVFLQDPNRLADYQITLF